MAFVRQQLFFLIVLLLAHRVFGQVAMLDSIRVALGSAAKQTDLLAKAYEENALKEVEGERYARAIDCNKGAIALYRSLKENIDEARNWIAIGEIHYRINDYEKAMDSYLSALDLFEREGSEEDILATKQLIGELHLRMEQCDQSYKIFHSVLNAYQSNRAKYKNEIPRTMQSLGIAHGGCGSLDSALFYFERALENVKKPYSGVFAGGLLNNIGAIYSKKDQNEKALSYYEDALKLFESDKNKEGIGVSISNQAYIFFKEGKFSKSIDLYLTAIDHFENAGSLVYLRNNCLNLSDAYERSGDYKSALKYVNKYLELNDSISNSDILSRINDLQMQFEIRKKDQERLLLEQESALSRSRLYLIIGGVIGLVFIIYLAYRNQKAKLKFAHLREQFLKQEKELLKSEVDFKSGEIESFVLKIVEKNKLLEQLKEELKAINKEQKNDSRISEITKQINDQLYIEKDRKEFELHLDKNYHSFFLRLDRRFPGMTKYERRLCSLLVMDLATKDISIILNISPESVKKSRNRLRKKLSLDPDVNLSEYLKNL